MSYALQTLWHERHRYLAAVLAVAFSTLLMVMQFGLLIGILSELGRPIDECRADIWVGYPGVPSVDLGLPIPEVWQARVASQPEVERVDGYIRGVVFIGKPQGGVEICTVIGTAMDDGSLGAIRELTPELRGRLAEPGTIVINDGEVENLGLRGLDDYTEVNGSRVRLVGTVPWVRGIAGAYLFCSVPTAQKILKLPPNQVTYLIASCRNQADAPAVVQRLRSYENLSAFTGPEFSSQSVVYWVTKTKAGVALGCAALLGLIVGAVVTAQTLYAATAAAIRQFAVLEALGIPGWRMALLVLNQSFWVGVLGIAVAFPLIPLFVWSIEALGGKIILPGPLLAGATLLTITMALLSGLYALRSLRLAEPMSLLR